MSSARRERLARRRPAPAAVAILDARLAGVDRLPPAASLALLVLASAALHVALGAAMRHARPRVVEAFPPPIRVVVAPEPLPPPPEAPPAPAPTPAPVHHHVAASRPAPAAATPTPVPETPPAPTPAPVAEAPLLMPGVALSATSVGGTMKVGVAGSPAGTPGGEGAGDGDAKPYHARELVPGYDLTEPPAFLDNVSAADVRRFYPEAARREKIEAVVRAKLLVDDDGSVVRATIVDDPGNGFGKAATKLARLYKFKPARVNGRAVATEIVFTIHFELD